jgi:hypothetical protein
MKEEKKSKFDYSDFEQDAIEQLKAFRLGSGLVRVSPAIETLNASVTRLVSRFPFNVAA